MTVDEEEEEEVEVEKERRAAREVVVVDGAIETPISARKLPAIGAEEKVVAAATAPPRRARDSADAAAAATARDREAGGGMGAKGMEKKESRRTAFEKSEEKAKKQFSPLIIK